MLDTSSDYNSENQDHYGNTANDTITIAKAKPGERQPDLEDKIKWLNKVHADTSLHPTVRLLITRLAIHHHNQKTGQINPSQETLAKALGITRQQANTLVQAAIASGWISKIKVGKSNHYRLEKIVVKEEPRTKRVKAALHDVSSAVDTSHVNASRQEHTNPSEHTKEHVSSGRKRKDFYNGKAKATALPNNWTLDKEKTAIAIEAGLASELVEQTFRMFVAHQRAKDIRNTDWNEAWRLWCLNAVRINSTRQVEKPDRPQRRMAI
jgi:DNA-binding XRE family transcriptional regulator